MVRVEDFRFTDHGKPVAPAGLQVLERLKGKPDDIRQVFLVTDGQRQMALKVRVHRSWKHRLRATRGHSYLHTESRMLPVASTAGLPVPGVLGYACKRMLGLVMQQALLVEWLPDRLPMMDYVTQAVDRGDHAAVKQAMSLQADMLTRIRCASLAEKDFGAHNLLIRITDGLPVDPYWVDLERAFHTSPNDPEATAAMVGVALSTWWVATRGDRTGLDAVVESFRQSVPAPHGGWSALTSRVNDVLDDRVKKARRFGLIDHAPQSITLTD